MKVKQKRVRDVVRTRLALVKNALPYCVAVKKEIWGDRHEMLALATVMQDLKRHSDTHHSSKEVKMHRKALQHLSSNATVSMNVDHLATDMSGKGVAWCDDMEVEIDAAIKAVFTDGFTDFDEPLISIDETKKT